MFVLLWDFDFNVCQASIINHVLPVSAVVCLKHWNEFHLQVIPLCTPEQLVHRGILLYFANLWLYIRLTSKLGLLISQFLEGNTPKVSAWCLHNNLVKVFVFMLGSLFCPCVHPVDGYPLGSCTSCRWLPPWLPAHPVDGLPNLPSCKIIRVIICLYQWCPSITQILMLRKTS